MPREIENDIKDIGTVCSSVETSIEPRADRLGRSFGRRPGKVDLLHQVGRSSKSWLVAITGVLGSEMAYAGYVGGYAT